MSKRVLPLLAAAAIALAGCSDTKGVDVNRVRGVVTKFAESSGPDACALLTPTALIDIYGGSTQPLAKARASCLARSKHFKGQAVTITTAVVTDPNTVKVGATNPKGDVTYTVTVRRIGSSWQIDDIRQARTKQ
jgi:hypothetical protein